MNPNTEVLRRGYDFVVIGAGSGGCVAAHILSQQGSVLLVEAGRQSLDMRGRRPVDYLQQFGSDNDWNLTSITQRHLANRVLLQPRGKGCGGSTRINASIWLEPDDHTLQKLAAAGGPLWSTSQVRAALAQIRAIVAPETPRWLSSSAQWFLDAAAHAGFPPLVYERMNHRGVRVTAADRFLGQPHADSRQANIHIQVLASTLVDRIETRAGRAVGVWLLPTATPYPGGPQNISSSSTLQPEFIAARRGVIIAAGTFQTPALLMRSGVGPADLLKKVGIRVAVDSPAVGDGLQDHLLVPFVLPLSPQAASENCFGAPWSPRELARWQAVGTGPIASNLAECGLLAGDNNTRCQFHVTPTDYLRYPHPSSAPALTIGVNGAWPKSRGRMWIESSNPLHPPKIDPQYLSNQDDFTAVRYGAQVAHTIASTLPLADRWLPAKSSPKWALHPSGTNLPNASQEADDRQLQRWIQRTGLSLYHPCGTCRLGQKADSVVDPMLQVRGLEAVWILDASIFAEIPGTNPNPLVMAMAWIAAQRIPSATP